MKYSYIQHRKKNPITPELQLLFTFFAITLFMLFLTYFFLLFKDYSFAKNISEIKVEVVRLDDEINNMNDLIVFIEKQSLLSERVFTNNTVLKDSIANMFDLVPQRITLSKAILLENGLVLYGVTPNKDVYNFMLQAPLRSIFHRTYSTFQPTKNGWLNFVSTNYIDKEEVIINED